MIDFPYLNEVKRTTPSKIVMAVLDGLGGMVHPSYGATELEHARTPVLDKLAGVSSCGVTTPVLPGITPGSGPGHMGLFGYDPVNYMLGRGILEGLGAGVAIGANDVAARGNFCLMKDGVISDRRAGRISSEQAAGLIEELKKINVSDFDICIYPVIDYRFVLVFKGRYVSPEITETDPQVTDVPVSLSEPKSPSALRMANAVNEFTESANTILSKLEMPANGILLRGFSMIPNLPDFGMNYGLTPAAIAAYPMYKGIAQLLGMDVLECEQNYQSEISVLKNTFNTGSYDFYFLHYKSADSAGEDGDFESKVAALEYFDSNLQTVLDMEPDVLVICGDHATPSYLASHSWPPVPFLINSKYSVGYLEGFTERNCRSGSIGSISSKELMMLVLAHAGKLNKFGP